MTSFQHAEDLYWMSDAELYLLVKKNTWDKTNLKHQELLIHIRNEVTRRESNGYHAEIKFEIDSILS